jgi:3-dehydroquinate dehydratase I
MTNILIGSCKLGAIPRVAAIIDSFLPIEKIMELKSIGTDLLEIRVDCFEEPIDKVCGYMVNVKRNCGLPLIGTIRENERTKSNRIDLFAKIIPVVDSIDVEIDAAIAPQVIDMAAGKTIIVSEHNYNFTPDMDGLIDIVERAAVLGGHIVKIAAMAHNRADVIRMLQFINGCKMPVVAFSMGESGSISRVMSMLFGSLYSYGFVTNANAPGQLGIEKLVEEMRLYFPEFGKSS